MPKSQITLETSTMISSLFPPHQPGEMQEKKKKKTLKIILSDISPSQGSIIWDSIQISMEFKGTFRRGRDIMPEDTEEVNKLPRGIRKTIIFLNQALSQKALNSSCSVLKQLITPFSLYTVKSVLAN